MYYNEYLLHYGVKGMRWGHRKHHDNSDNTKKTITPDDKSKDKKVKIKKTKRNKALKIGAITVASVLAAYGTYKLIDSGAVNSAMMKGKAYISGHPGVFYKENKDLKKSMSPDEIMKNVVDKINPDYHNKIGTVSNCRRCTFAYEMRRRGYDVAATKTISATGQDTNGLRRAFGIGTISRKELIDKINATQKRYGITDITELGEKARLFILPKRSIDLPIMKEDNAYKTIFETLSKMPNGSRGEISNYWTNGGGHSRAWEIIDGKPVIFDCQTGQKFLSYLDFPKPECSSVLSATITRLDDAELDMDFLTKWLKNI